MKSPSLSALEPSREQASRFRDGPDGAIKDQLEAGPRSGPTPRAAYLNDACKSEGTGGVLTLACDTHAPLAPQHRRLVAGVGEELRRDFSAFDMSLALAFKMLGGWGNLSSNLLLAGQAGHVLWCRCAARSFLSRGERGEAAAVAPLQQPPLVLCPSLGFRRRGGRGKAPPRAERTDLTRASAQNNNGGASRRAPCLLCRELTATRSLLSLPPQARHAVPLRRAAEPVRAGRGPQGCAAVVPRLLRVHAPSPAVPPARPAGPSRPLLCTASSHSVDVATLSDVTASHCVVALGRCGNAE